MLKYFVSAIGAVLALIILSPQLAEASPGGTVVNYNGTVYLKTATVEGGPDVLSFPSKEIFESWGYKFSDVRVADAADIQLIRSKSSVSPFSFRDGMLLSSADSSDRTVYIVYQGCKYAFPSGNVFLGLGYKFENIKLERSAALANLCSKIPPYNLVTNSPTGSHPSGSLIMDNNGTVYWVTGDGLIGFPSLAVFNSYGLKFGEVVPMNAADYQAYAATSYGAVRHRDMRFLP